MADSILAEVLDHGDAAVAACEELEGLSAWVRAARDGDDAVALHFAIERAVKAVRTAAGKALQASNKAMADRITRREANWMQTEFALTEFALAEKGDSPQERIREATNGLRRLGARLSVGRAMPDGIDRETGEVR